MPTDRVIAIGGSAGALKPLEQILSALPSDFDTPILVVVHLAPEGPPILASLLKSKLQVITAEDEMVAQSGAVYVAPPDRHLVVDSLRHLRVLNGPRENRSRPAIDPLFRSVAQVYGNRAIGTILSGGLDDGSAGLAFLRKTGAGVIVQDPAEAAASEMPRAAMRLVPDAARMSLEAIVTAYIQFSSRQLASGSPMKPIQLTDLEGNFDPWVFETNTRTPSKFTCPDCSGTLFELKEDGLARYRCRTGHGYSAESLRCDQTQNLERLLWSAARALEERSDLNQTVAIRFEACGDQRLAARAQSQAEQDLADAEKLRTLLFRTVS
jgi:two-component system chemotaxis response regulator CheB